MKTKVLFALMTGIALLFAACSENESVDESLSLAEKSAELGLALCDGCTYDGVLSDAEIESLMKMREEEKFAHDVYLKFYELWDQPVFQNIANSEEAHTSAVLNLINGYELDDPALEGEGEFSNPDFAALYTSLVAEGAESLEAALRAGAFIEEYDIADLIELLSVTENEDVARVYTNLLNGSESHLRAFTNVLNSLGVVYEPQVLTNEKYDEILSGQNGNRGRGNGNGGNYGNGSYGTNGTGVCDSTQSGTGNAYQKGKNGNAGKGKGQ